MAGGSVLSSPPKEYTEFQSQKAHYQRLCQAFSCTLTELLTVIPEDWILKQVHIWRLEYEVSQEKGRRGNDD